VLVSISIAKGQQGEEDKNFQYVVVPSDIVLLTIAHQPDCPLQFEQGKLLAGVAGGGGATYKLRNQGTKPIKGFTIAKLGVGAVGASTWYLTDEMVLPGQLVPLPENTRDKIIPLTKELRQKLGLHGAMKGVVVLMVVRVEYADGTTYNDEAVLKALEAYSENLYNKMERLEYLESLQRQPKK
jgi:hypothetical protein